MSCKRNFAAFCTILIANESCGWSPALEAEFYV